MSDKNSIKARAKMLVRKPVSEVFEAFTNPEITSRFWFTRGSGKLEVGKTIAWHWDMYGMFTSVKVKAIEKDRRILVEWSGYGTPTSVEWIFTPRIDGNTFVSIKNNGFQGDAEKACEQAIDSAEGFALVLAGLKAYLEHGILLNLIRDRHPDLLLK